MHNLKTYWLYPLTLSAALALAACGGEESEVGAEAPPEDKTVEGDTQKPSPQSRTTLESGTADDEAVYKGYEVDDDDPGRIDGQGGDQADGGPVGAPRAEDISPEGYTLGPVTMGSPDAPVTVIEYASMTCSHCARFDQETLPKLKERYIATGKVRYVFHNFVLNQADMAASMVIRCQGPQQFFALTDLFFERQSDWVQQDFAAGIAKVGRRAGISRTDVDRCLADRSLQQHLVEMRQSGQDEWTVEATPTIIVAGEKRGPEAQRFEDLAAMIDAEL